MAYSVGKDVTDLRGGEDTCSLPWWGSYASLSCDRCRRCRPKCRSQSTSTRWTRPAPGRTWSDWRCARAPSTACTPGPHTSPRRESARWMSPHDGLEPTIATQWTSFLANSRSLYAIARPSVVCLSVVCNVRVPYSGGSNFRQYFNGIRYLGHSLTSTENFTEIVPEEPLHHQGS